MVGAGVVVATALGRHVSRFHLCTWAVAATYVGMGTWTRFRGNRWTRSARTLVVVGGGLAVWLTAEAAVRTVRDRETPRNAARRRLMNAYRDEFVRLCRAGLHRAGSLQPGFHGRCLGSDVSINSHGTRGREFAARQGPGEIRVVCVGGSTTFGATAGDEARPYPDVLEGILHVRLGRPVTVINGGVSAYTARLSADRFESKLLAFHPDVVVVYHGINDVLHGLRDAPRFTPRASLLVEAVRRWWIDRHGDLPGIQHDPSDYLRAYHRILQRCRSRHVAVCLVSFALAFDDATPLDDVRYYESIMPLYPGQTAGMLVQAIRDQNARVERMARAYGATSVDAAGELMGRQALFLDFVHFHQPGRDRLAALVADGVLRALGHGPAATRPTATQTAPDPARHR